MGKRKRLLCLAAVALFGTAAPAQAANFTVNSTADGHDATPGNNVCETATGNGVCTLRAAIEEANALTPQADTITLPAGTYNRTVQYQSSLSSAEWIEEAPSSGRGTMLPLDNFGSVTFSNASATRDGHTVNLVQSGAVPITMAGGRGRALVAPSAITEDGAGFTATRANPSALPVPSDILQRGRRALGV